MVSSSVSIILDELLVKLTVNLAIFGQTGKWMNDNGRCSMALQ